MTKKTIGLNLCMLFFSTLIVGNTGKAVLINNTLEELRAVMGKVQLNPVRIWGSDDEEDEHKFFKTIGSILMSEKGYIYICDTDSHNIKVFDNTGNYMHTIGRRGRGPGDLFQPNSLAISPAGDLWIFEFGGRRLQCFSPQGKSIKIIKALHVTRLIGVTSSGELVLSSYFDTFRSRKLISIINSEGKTLRKIGTYHDPSKSYVSSEKLNYAIDGNENIYALNARAPVLRKYSKEGRMEMVITLETPFEVPYRVRLNSNRNEIEKVYSKEYGNSFKNNIKKGAGGVIQAKGKYIPNVANTVAVDSKGRIFMLTQNRLMTTEELKGSAFIWTSGKGIDRSYLNLPLMNKMHIFRLAVFSSDGKIIAALDLKIPTSRFYLHDKTIFLKDSYNQQIFEYRIQFKD